MESRSNQSLNRGNDLCLGARPAELWNRNAELLETVPVMSGTILGLEMVTRRSSIDISMATEIVSSDIGACIHLLRWAGRQYGFRQGGPTRISECISIIEPELFLEILSARIFVTDAAHCGWIEVKERCQRVAKFARLIAESIIGVSPDDAYLVGLLCDKGSIGNVLGWWQDPTVVRSCGEILATEGSLPQSTSEAFEKLKENDPTSTWSIILNGAHELADSSNSYF